MVNQRDSRSRKDQRWHGLADGWDHTLGQTRCRHHHLTGYSCDDAGCKLERMRSTPVRQGSRILMLQTQMVRRSDTSPDMPCLISTSPSAHQPFRRRSASPGCSVNIISRPSGLRLNCIALGPWISWIRRWLEHDFGSHGLSRHSASLLRQPSLLPFAYNCYSVRPSSNPPFHAGPCLLFNRFLTASSTKTNQLPHPDSTLTPNSPRRSSS